MKEELLKILQIKLKYLNDNIDALNRMNNNLDFENENLNYVRSILNLFEEENGQYSVYNFSKLDRENFNKIMMDLPDEVLDKFGTSSCNYEGLIYLVNGINNGISLTLTKEQTDAVDFMYNSIINRQMDYLAHIDGILLAKSRLDISDIDELNRIRDKFNNIIEKLETEKYVDETEEIIDAINYSRVPNEKIIEILSYLLEYNSEIYHLKKEQNPKEEPKEPIQSVLVNEDEEELDLSKPFVVPTEAISIPIEEEKDFNELNIDRINEEEKETEEDAEVNNDIPVTDEAKEETTDESVEEQEELENYDLADVEIDEAELQDDDLEMPTDESDEELPVDEDFQDLVDEDNYYEEYHHDEIVPPVVDINIPVVLPNIEVDEEEDNVSNETNEEVEVEQEIEKEQPEVSVQEEVTQAVTLTEEDIKEIFKKYKVKYEAFTEHEVELLLKGNFENYHTILTFLDDKNLLNTFEKNPALLTNVLVYSNQEIIENVFAAIKESLSVDDDDMKITTNIVIASLPSVFVKEPLGNHETFLNNIRLFKEWGIDLINLFDFSREMLVMNRDQMKKNYELVKSYDLTVNDKNAKYLLVLPNVEEKIDYYMEAIATDTMKNGTGKTFDGSEYIKLYPNKLNTVNDVTIKRLKYSSENGRKLFGSKENSLAGEITNLKVDVINMDDDYTRKYFNNEFDVIDHDEFLNYKKMIRDAKEYSININQDLEMLEKYRNGMRYTIEGVNISRNKLIRNYNILIKNGIERTKALIFAACYNSVITKEEYKKVKDTLSNIGGR